MIFDEEKKRAWNCKYLLQFANLIAGHLFEDVLFPQGFTFCDGVHVELQNIHQIYHRKFQLNFYKAARTAALWKLMRRKQTQGTKTPIIWNFDYKCRNLLFVPESSVIPLLMKLFTGSKEMRKCTPVVRLQCQVIVQMTFGWFYRYGFFKHL